MKFDNQLLICIFPYIEIEEPFRIRGEMLYPSLSIQRPELSLSNDDHLAKLLEMFYWYNNRKIENMTWTIVEASNNSRRIHEFREHLEEIRKILGYIFCLPDDRPQYFSVYPHYEQFDYYLFEPESGIPRSFIRCVRDAPLSKEEEKVKPENYVDGYKYLLNQVDTVSVMEGCRIYPQSTSILGPYNIAETLERIDYVQFKPNVIFMFNEDRLDDRDAERIFSTIEWYNRSCKASITTDMSLISLATAFETLLGTRRSMEVENIKITQKLQSSIQTLVGDTPRLDMWFKQFYDARSRILHEGQWSQLRFFPDNKVQSAQQTTNEYGYLTHYGWLIFRICLDAVLAGLLRASRIDLKSKFFTHQERLERMLKNLTKEKDPYSALVSVLDDVRTLYQFPYPDFSSIQLDVAWQVSQKLAEYILQTDASISDEQKIILEQIVQDFDPLEISNQDKINEHITFIFQNTDELPNDTVIEPALADLTNEHPPSLLEIKSKIEDILNDKRNNSISEELRRRLKNSVELIEIGVYSTKLSLVAQLATNRAGAFISKQRFFSLIDGYSRFIESLINDRELDVRIYISANNRFWSK